MEVKALETKYKGYRFRSRLEAKWAVFFDTVGIKWQYEIEGFKKGRKCYLPDFYLPDEDMYVEVKPIREGSTDEVAKAADFLGDTIKTLVLLPNLPDEKKGVWCFSVLYYHPVSKCVDYKFVPLCINEMTEQAEFVGDISDPVPEDIFQHRGCFWIDKKGEQRVQLVKYLLTPQFLDENEAECLGLGWEKINEAYNTAKAKRFEHGEK